MKSLLRGSIAALLAVTLVGVALELHRDEYVAALEDESAPVFSSARHHRDSAHLEGAELSHRSDCRACLLLKSPTRLAAPPRAVSQLAMAAAAPRVPASPPLDSHTLLRASRGPPLS